MLEMKIVCWASPRWATPWYRLTEWLRRTWHTFFGHDDMNECYYLEAEYPPLPSEWYCKGCQSFLVRRGV